MNVKTKVLLLLTGALLSGAAWTQAPKRGFLIKEASKPAAVPSKPAETSARPAATPAKSAGSALRADRATKPAIKPATKPAPRAVAPRKGPPPMTGKSAGRGMGPLAPYRSAIAVDAASGRVLFADHEDRASYPASVTKLMTFLLVLEDVQKGVYKLTDMATASRYATTMEPSSVGIKPGESMTIEDLLYSIMVKSANDAAVVLAEHAAWARSGDKGPFPVEAKEHALLEAFIARMNRRAHELGMKDTRYASPNGLPPGIHEKRGFDTSTAMDISKLARAVVRIPGALKYTSCTKRMVKDGSGQLSGLATHNYFLPGSFDKDGCARPVEGCDGLKTGYTMVSGSSIALTASRYGRRVVVVVLGSAGRHEREAAAGRILRDALDAVSIW